MDILITIYHGSKQIVEVPTFGRGRKNNSDAAEKTTISVWASTAPKAATLQKNGLSPR